MIAKLIVLADKLDSGGHKKAADVVDDIVLAARLEDFDDLTKLWGGKVKLDDTDEEASMRATQLPEDDELPTPSDEDLRPEEEARLERKMEGAEGERMKDYDHPVDRKSIRLDELKRRHELLKLKKMLETMEDEEGDDAGEVELEGTNPEVISFEDEKREDERTSLSPEDKAKLDEMKKMFEAEDDEEFEPDMNNADDEDDDFVAELEMKLKNAPELVGKLLKLIKENPELIAELAL